MHSSPRILAVASLAAAVTTAAAQPSRVGGPAGVDDPSPRIAVDLSLGGNLARGFVDREMVAARGMLEASSGDWTIYNQPYWLFARVHPPMGAALTTDNEIYDRTGIFRRLGKRWFVYGVNAYDRSRRRQIDHRDLFGGGGGAALWKSGPSSLQASVGALYEVTAYTKSPVLLDADDVPIATADGVRQTGRFSVRIYGRYRLADGKVNLTHDLIVIPSDRDPSHDYRVLAYGAIQAPIAKGFSFVVQADATHEGVIANGTKHGDLAITFGIAYKNLWRSAAAAPRVPVDVGAPPRSVGAARP